MKNAGEKNIYQQSANQHSRPRSRARVLCRPSSCSNALFSSSTVKHIGESVQPPHHDHPVPVVATARSVRINAFCRAKSPLTPTAHPTQVSPAPPAPPAASISPSALLAPLLTSSPSLQPAWSAFNHSACGSQALKPAAKRLRIEPKFSRVSLN